MKSLIFLFLSAAVAFGQTYQAAPTVGTVADLVARKPSTVAPSISVLGKARPGDWEAPRIATWSATNTLATNAIRLAVSGVSTGRYVLDWSDRDIRVWGVRGDGTTSDSAAFQAALDYVESEVNAGLSGGVIRVPDRMKILVSSTIRMRNGVSIIAASDRNADRGYPMDQTAPRFIAAPGLRAPIFEFADYTNAAAANPRMIVLKGLVFDGNFDAQSTNDLALVGISLRSTLAKNISIEGCAFYDTPGYSIFAMDGFNAGTIRDCFLGNGLFTTVSADLKVSDTDITGRTRGSLAAGTPYPPVWLGPFTQKNQFSDVMVYMGPRAEVGYDNSLRRWSISTADGSANTLTLASTNGMFDGLPVVWRSGGALPSGVQTNQLCHVLWSGSATIQIASSSGYRTRTPLDFGAVSLSSDVLQMGEAAMLYSSGGSSVAQNAFSNLRIEDSYGDLIHLDGAHDNAFSNPMLGFSYTNSGRFVRLTRGAQGNTFSGGMAAWNYPNQFGQQPQTIVEIDAESRANRFQGVRMSNASVQTVIDRNVTEPGNVWDYEEPSTMWMRGLDASFRFWDYNSAVTNSMWWNGNSVFWTLNESDPLNTYDWGFDGSNQILEIHGATAPGLRIQGYTASSAPSITLRNKGGTRASPSQTPVSSTLGSIFFAGRDTSADTSARAAITAVTPSTGWPSTTDTPTELWFAVTPDGTATRTNLFGIQGDLTSADTPLMLSIGGAAPVRVKRDSSSGALYTGTYSGGGGSTNGVSDGNKGAIGVSGGGTNWQINASVIHSTNLIDGTVSSSDLADSAVTSAKIADGTIATSDLADSAVTGAKIANSTISTNKLDATAMSAITFDAEAAAAYQPLDSDLTALGALNGGSLTNLNGTEIRSGTVDEARIDSAITRDAEAAATFEPLRSTVSQAEAEAGTATTVRGWTAERVKQAITALAPGGGSTVTVRTNGLTGNPIVLHPDLSIGPTNEISVTNITVSGTLTISSGLSGDIITSGTVADARIASTIARDSEVAAGYQPLDSDLTTLATLNGASLTNLNGTEIRSGTVAEARIDSAIARDSEVAAAYQPLDSDLTTLAGNNGSALTSLNGSQISSGTVADARIDSAIARDSEVTTAIQTAFTNTVQVASVTIFDPDGVQAVSDAVPMLAAESTWAPNGITIKDIYLKTDASSTYSINLEEWTSPTDGSPATIETVATSSSTEAEDDGTLADATVAAGSIVFIDLPSTAANWIQVTVTYYIK